METPEAKARRLIDDQLRVAGWVVQNLEELNLFAGQGVAVREVSLSTGIADYLLFAGGKALGIIEAKRFGTTLTVAEPQTSKYSVGLPQHYPSWRAGEPLPFLYEASGYETFFTNRRDPDPRSRRVFHFHQPQTLIEWAQEKQPLRERLCQMPPLEPGKLWDVQVRAINNLEESLAENHPRSLIQMATGSGKTFTAINFIYRLIKFAHVRRILFLVDRTNLGTQAEREFGAFVTPDDGRKFGELYNLQHLSSNYLDDVSRVHITTIQRLYSILSGESIDVEEEQLSLYERSESRQIPTALKTVRYNPDLPIEYYDFIVVDECHRSIYNVWRQVLDYFDAFLIGLTATPSKQTIGFFNRNLVMEYSRDRAVADGINVPGEVYRIQTRVAQEGSTVEAGYSVGIMDKSTRRERQELLDQDFTYSGSELDRSVTARDQIRTVIRTFRDRLFTEIFPGRHIVPKTLVFAKDDNHAEEIVRIIREEFGKGNDFCQKVTYKVQGDPDDIVAAFRNSFYPRIAVTVDLISTGTDVKPLEILLFMRDVKSRNYFEQMLGRGVRVISRDDLLEVTSDAGVKDHFVIVDAVGVTEQEKKDTTGQLLRKRSIPFARLVERVVLGSYDEDIVSSLADRLARMEHKMNVADFERIQKLSGGPTFQELVHGLIDALEVDRQLERAQESLVGGVEPAAEQIEAAARELMDEAVLPLRINVPLRKAILEIHERNEIVIDEVTLDEVIDAGFDAEATDRARALVSSFQEFIEENKDEITALQILYNQPYDQQRLTYEQIKDLQERLSQPPRGWTTEQLWRAYAQIEKDRVRGVGTERALTDIISLVRHAIRPEDDLLVPYPELVQQRYQNWLASQEADGKTFTPEQRWWLDRIAYFIGMNLEMLPEDFDVDTEMFKRGGRAGARRELGADWVTILSELNGYLN